MFSLVEIHVWFRPSKDSNMKCLRVLLFFEAITLSFSNPWNDVLLQIRWQNFLSEKGFPGWKNPFRHFVFKKVNAAVFNFWLFPTFLGPRNELKQCLLSFHYLFFFQILIKQWGLESFGIKKHAKVTRCRLVFTPLVWLRPSYLGNDKVIV